MDSFLWDVRHGVRGLLRTPGFTLIAVLTLALGIGANTSIFSLLDEVFLRPLAIREPRELAQVFTRSGDRTAWDFSYPEFQDLAKGAPSRPVMASAVTWCALDVGDQSVHAYGQQVSGNTFDLLGVPMFAGRPITTADDREGAAPVVVLSYDVWRSRFGADRALIGKPVRLDQLTVTVVGVAAPRFRGTLRGLPVSFWVPIHLAPAIMDDPEALRSRNMSWMTLFTRVPPRDWVQARAELQHGLELGAPSATRGRSIVLRAAGGGDLTLLEGPGRLSRVLMALVLVLLTIACANVAGLLLARTEGRRREIAIRLALGSSTGRLARQSLIESLLLSIAGGALGLLVATWTTHVLEAFRPASFFPVELAYRLDGRVLLFTVAVTLVTGIGFGLAPALQARGTDLLQALKRDAGAGWWNRRRLDPRRVLVGAQVALSVVLLTAAGLFLRTLWNERSVPLGFDPHDRIAMSLDLGATGHDRARTALFYQQLLERVRALPGVTSATVTQFLPVSRGGNTWSFAAGDLRLPNSPAIDIDITGVGDDYFRTMGIPLRRGREMTPAETYSGERTFKAVINRTLAERLWPGQDPVGKALPLLSPERPPFEIVGVVDNARHRGLRGDDRPCLYMSSPVPQSSSLILVAHVVPGAGNLFSAIATLVGELDPRVAVFEPTTLERHVAESMVESRFGATLLGAFGLLAAGLTALGLYGLLAFAVTRRTREIGLRLVFGATPARVLRMIVAESFVIAIPGLLAGLALALGLSKLMTHLVYGVTATDPWTYASMLGLMALSLLVAALVPGARAARLEPMAALREE
jgi:predicted permease